MNFSPRMYRDIKTDSILSTTHQEVFKLKASFLLIDIINDDLNIPSSTFRKFEILIKKNIYDFIFSDQI